MRAGDNKKTESMQYGLFYPKDDVHIMWSVQISVFMGGSCRVLQSSLIYQGAV